LEDRGPAAALEGVQWIDLMTPTADEKRVAEAWLGVELPSRQEAEEIEVSSRLYVEKNTLFMIVTVMLDADSPNPTTTPVTFAFQHRRLVTMRFAEPKPFVTFPRRLKRAPSSYPSAQRLLLGLLDEIIDRVADVLEGVGSDLTQVSRLVFSAPTIANTRRAEVDFTEILARIGHNGLRAANARESLVSLGRVVPFFAEAVSSHAGEPLDDHWPAVAKDVASLTDHATFLSNKVNFFLDATLGRINIEQNTIIKLFSVLAVVFLPPTLIASIYGMNFVHMPELGWKIGYPLSLGLMALVAIFPYLVFKRRGWF
jgi:magnesium transporter